MYDSEEMECSCLRLSGLPKTTRLFVDFLDNFPKVSAFYAHPPDEAGLLASARAAREDGPSAEIRKTVVKILAEENRAFGSDESVARNLERLANGAVAVVTGQQTALFGGPAYTIYKALTAIHWADWLTRQGIDAVPVFWLASEDHDFAEVNHVEWMGRDVAMRLEYSPRGAGRGEPVGGIPLGEEIRGVTEQAIALLEGPHAEDVAVALRESYAPGQTYGSAFGKLLARVFKGRGLILLDPQNAGLHRLAGPVLRAAIEKSDALTEGLLARRKALEKEDYHAQVKVTPQSTLLFRLVDGKREAVRKRGEGFVAGAKTFSREEALEAIARAPEEFSANVLLRPVMQDFLLPTAAYIGGAAEIAYFAQAQTVYRALGVRMPVVLPRAGFTLVDLKTARLLKKYKLRVTDLFAGRQRLRSKMEQEILPKDLARRFRIGEKALRRLLKNFRGPLRRLDATLVGSLETAEKKMLYQYLKLHGKAGRAVNFRTGALDKDERRLVDGLYPARALQERSLSALPFLAATSGDLLEELLNCIRQPGSALQHHVLRLR